MTELGALLEELISWEFDGQAIIATGTLLTSLGQVAGCGVEYQHSAGASWTQTHNIFMWDILSMWGFLWSTEVGIKLLLFVNSFTLFTWFSGAELSLGAELRHLCNVLICVTAFHIVLGTFGESYCYAITLGASACTAVSEDNWVLWFEAQGSPYILIRALYNVTQGNCCFHFRGTSEDQNGDFTCCLYIC